jgi:uncharacterized phage protein (TIGR01671 family)
MFFTTKDKKMNRAIKFRGWKHRQNEMISWEQIKHNSGHDLSYGHWDLFIRPDLMIPLQYTGLNDKNGKEIYEGDILKYTYSDSLNNWLVEYKGACFVIVNIGIDGYLGQRFPLETGDLTERIVIGNCYENPALLRENATVL